MSETQPNFESHDVPVYTTLAIDPATTAKDYSDPTGITVVGTSAGGDWYVLEADPYKGQPTDVVDRVAMYALQYRPARISCEIIAAQRLYIPLFNARFKELGINIPITPYTYSTRISKRTRIESLQPLFKKKKVFIKRGLHELVRQLRQFPEVEHDDLLDSLVQHLSISRNFDPRHSGALPLDAAEFWVDTDEDDSDKNESPRTNGSWVGKGTSRYVRSP